MFSQKTKHETQNIHIGIYFMYDVCESQRIYLTQTIPNIYTKGKVEEQHNIKNMYLTFIFNVFQYNMQIFVLNFSTYS